MKRHLVLILLIVLSACAVAEPMAGGWENVPHEAAELSVDAQAAFDKAIEGLDDAEYTPVALLSTQVVAGMNYCILCQVTPVNPDSIHGTTDTLERDTVIFLRFNRERCIGCGRCEVSCADGGHQAIHLNAERRPVLNGRKCVGCHLCVLVCPQRAIVPGSKRVMPRAKR